MKINVDIDATPEELRTFFGLPDVAPIQKEVLERMRDKMLESIDSYDAMTMLKPLMTEQLQSMEQFQKMFWSSMKASGAKPKE